MVDDPFPREAFGALVRRLPAYGRLAWRLGRDPRVSRGRRAAVVGAAGYVASPIDLVPGIIPLLGQLDDIAVLLAALRFALDGLDPTRRRTHLAAVGLTDADLAADTRAVGLTGAWAGRAGVRVGARAARGGARIAATGSRLLGRAAVGTARWVAAAVDARRRNRSAAGE
jgi:uncharacterized membrane protein YkvA (DUF1232 family)